MMHFRDKKRYCKVIRAMIKERETRGRIYIIRKAEVKLTENHQQHEMIKSNMTMICKESERVVDDYLG